MKTKHRGIAMITVLGIVVFLTIIVAFAITISGRDQRETGKLIHNLNIQQMTEATLQRARGYFAVRKDRWNPVLAYFVSNPVILQPPSAIPAAIAKLTSDGFGDLINPNTPQGYTCYMYARDNIDEFPPLNNNPSVDNDGMIYIGAVCVQTGSGGSAQSSPLIAELTAPLLDSSSSGYKSQASGGTEGINNISQVSGYR